jgi:hypothetical protein
MEGLEPPQPCGHMDLNHARLPIPPHPHIPIGKIAATGSDSYLKPILPVLSGIATAYRPDFTPLAVSSCFAGLPPLVTFAVTIPDAFIRFCKSSFVGFMPLVCPRLKIATLPVPGAATLGGGPASVLLEVPSVLRSDGLCVNLGELGPPKE